MTKEEKLIVSAYTRILMVDVGEFRAWLDENNYVDPLMFLTPESSKDAFDTLRMQVKDKFMALCKFDTTETSYKAEPISFYEAPQINILTTRNDTVRRITVDGQELVKASDVTVEDAPSANEYSYVTVTYAVPPCNVHWIKEL
jgi:hypothetical protein